jgi:hypothetical protein
MSLSMALITSGMLFFTLPFTKSGLIEISYYGNIKIYSIYRTPHNGGNGCLSFVRLSNKARVPAIDIPGNVCIYACFNIDSCICYNAPDGVKLLTIITFLLTFVNE